MSQTTQQSLTRVDVALKMGLYEFGSSRHTERRPNNLPFSNLTFREDDLSRLHSRMSLIRTDTGEGREQPISVRAVSREEVMRHNRPDSILSYGGGPGVVSMSSMVSASERLLTAPIGEKPERLLARRKKEGKTELRGPQDQGRYMRTASSLPEGRGENGGDLVIVESLDSKGRRHLVGDNRNSMAPSRDYVDNQQSQGNEHDLERQENMLDQDIKNNTRGDIDDRLNIDLGEVNPESIQSESSGQGRQTLTVNLREGHHEGSQGPLGNGISTNVEKPEGLAHSTNYNTDEEAASQRLQETVSKKSVVIRPASGSRRMFEKYSSGGNAVGEQDLPYGSLVNMVRPSTMSAKTAPRAVSTAKTMSSARSRRVWSGRSIASSATSGNLSRRHIPGPHDLSSSARTVGGPNSSLSSLLGEPPRPRPASRPSEHHHRAAWYHVPGRYATPQERFPRKRMQKTENARDIEAFVALKSQWAKRRQIELQQARLRDLQLEEQGGGNYDETYPESDVMDGAQPRQHTKRNYVSSSKQKGPSGWNSSSKKSTRSSESRSNLGPARRLIQPNWTPRLMISGLDMVPEQRYPDRGQVYYTPPQGQAVKFREPIVVG